MTSIQPRDDFDSISEGCFLVLPSSSQTNHGTKNKRKRTNQSKVSTTVSSTAKRRLSTDTEVMKYDGFQQLFNGMESIECMLLRKNAYEDLWKKTNSIMDNVLLDLNHSIRHQIRHFVDTSDDTSDNSLIPMPYHEIPAALVFAGINTPDHSTQFKEIGKTLRDQSSNRTQNRHYVASLSSQTCHSLKTIMSTMIEQFMNHDHDVFTSTRKRNDHGSSLKVNEEETISHQETIQHNDLAEEGNTSYQLGGSYITTKPVKLASHDLQILVGWYLETIEQRQLNGNKKEWPKLVVILEDFESFDPLLLQDFMTIISEYRVQLPFVFIIGIATSTEILHQSLTKSTICLLRIEKFWLQQSDVWFNRVLDKIFIESDFTLKFGAKPYKFLLDHFYLFDFSISKVKASVKYALMHHFYSNPLSIFLSLAGQPYTTLLETVTRWYQENIITVDHAAHVRMLRSFRQFIEDLVDDTDGKQEDELDKNRQLALKLLNDDCYLMTEQLATWLVDLGRYQRHFQRGMALLQFLQSQFPHTKKKTRRLLYLEQLENSQWGTQADTIQYLVTLVRKMEATALEPFLEQLTNILQDYDDNTWKDKMTTWQHQLKTWQSASDQEKAKMKQKEKRLEGMIVSSTNRIPTSMESSSSRQTKTAEKVQENAFAQLREKGTLTSKMAMEIADWLQSILRHDLRSYTSIPAHELIYYTHVKLHEKSFAPQPRGSIQTALNQSQYYLNCDCCQQDRQSLLPSEQDTSLLYKLYLECGRMINLYDWFVAFGCLIEREHRPDGHPLDENEVQARFIRSVAELQFLGFIKSTQRKTDHVIRLTWSNI